MLKRRKMSGAQLFVDIIGAFDAVVREVLMPTATIDSDQHVAMVLQKLSLPQHIHQLAQYISEGSYMSRCGIDPHLLAVTADTHAHTWASTQGLAQPIRTCYGSKPGDPLGDV